MDRLKENKTRIIVGVLVSSLFIWGIANVFRRYFVMGPNEFWGKENGQLLFVRTMKQSLDVLSKEMVREIFIMDLKTRKMRQLTDHRSITIRPIISPNDKWIAYTSYVFHKKEKIKNANLFIYNLMTRERRIVSYKKGMNLAGSFSILENAIYFTLHQGSLINIFYENLENNSLIAVTSTENRKGKFKKNKINNSEPSLSPDGKMLVFVSDREGRPTLYIKDQLSGEEKRLVYSGVYNTRPRWSPNGERIIFQGYIKGHFDIFIIDINGKNLKRITQAFNLAGLPANNEYPDFSNDGNSIIYTSDRTGYNQLYVTNLNTQKTRRITFDTFHYYYPRWIGKILPTDI